MALSQSSLAGKIKSEIINQLGDATDDGLLTKISNAIAKAVVDEIKANAVVSVTTSTSGAQAGGATLSGTGTGTVS